MVKPIMRDVLFLGQKSIPATEEDLQVGRWEEICRTHWQQTARHASAWRQI